MASHGVRGLLLAAVIGVLSASGASCTDSEATTGLSVPKADLDMARRLYAEQKWADAIPLLVKNLSSLQGEMQTDYKCALLEAYRGVKDYGNSVKLCKELLVECPDAASQWYYIMGDDLAEQGSYVEALSAYQMATKKAVEVCITPDWQYRRMAWCHTHIDPKAGLDAFLANTLKERPDMWVEAAFSAACELIDRKIDADKGARLLKKIPVTSPNNWTARPAVERLVAFYRDLKSWPDAVTMCNELAKQTPQEAAKWLYISGRCLVWEGKYQDALEAFQSALPKLTAGNPARLDTFRQIGDCYLHVDHKEALDKYLAKLEADEPDAWPEVAYLCGRGLVQNKLDIDKGLGLVQQLKTKRPDHAIAKEADQRFFNFCRGFKDYDIATKLYKHMLAEKPDAASQYYYMLGDDMAELGRYEEALSAFKSAAKEVIGRGGVPGWQYRRMAWCHVHIDSKAGLDAFLEATHNERPDVWIEAAFSAACELIDQKIDVDKGLNLLKRIPFVDPKHWSARLATEKLVGLCRELNGWPDAETMCREFAKQSPEEEAKWLYILGRCFVWEGKYADALEVLEPVVSRLTASSPERLDAFRQMGDCHMHIDHGAALDTYLAKLETEEPDAWPEVAHLCGYELVQNKLDIDKGLGLVTELKTKRPEHRLAKDAEQHFVEFCRDLKDYDIASKLYKHMLAEYPDATLQWYYMMGEDLTELGKYMEALSAFQSAAKEVIGWGGIPDWQYRGMGWCHTRIDPKAGLDAFLANTLEERPDMWVEAAFSAACELIDQKIDVDKGVDLLKRIATTYHKHCSARPATEKLVGLFRELKGWPNAETMCKEFAKQSPEDEAKWFYVLGRSMVWEGRYEDAVRVFKSVAPKMAAAGLDRLDALRDMGGCYLHIDPHAALDTYLAKLRAEEPAMWPEVAYPCGCSLVSDRLDVEKGLDLVNRVIAEWPEHRLASEAQEKLVDLYRDLKDWPGAERVCDVLVAKHPQEAGKWLFWKADCLKNEGKHKESIPVFELGLPMMAANGIEATHAYLSMGDSYMRSDPGAGLDTFLAKLFTTDPKVWGTTISTIGAVMIEEKIDMEKGMKLLYEFTSKMPEHPSAEQCQMEMAQFLIWWLNRPDEARELLTRIAKQPRVDIQQLNYWLGHCSYVQQDWATANGLFKSVCDGPMESRWKRAAEYMAGDCCVRLGDESTARRHFETLLSEYPQDSLAKDAPRRIAELSRPKD